MAADVQCRGEGCERDSEQLFSLVAERITSRNYLDSPFNVRVRRAGAAMKGSSLLFGFEFLSLSFSPLRQVRQCLLGTPSSVSVWELM